VADLQTKQLLHSWVFNHTWHWIWAVLRYKQSCTYLWRSGPPRRQSGGQQFSAVHVTVVLRRLETVDKRDAVQCDLQHTKLIELNKSILIYYNVYKMCTLQKISSSRSYSMVLLKYNVVTHVHKHFAGDFEKIQIKGCGSSFTR